MPPRKPRPGRPRRTTGRSTDFVGLKITPGEKSSWQAAAEREGLTLSQWLRAAAELAIARGATR